MKIILASASPRRQEILTQANILYELIPSQVEEVFNHNISIEDAVMDLAYQKANWVYKNNQDALIIGADTIVVVDNEVLGKPKDYNDACRMLNKLQNNDEVIISYKGKDYVYRMVNSYEIEKNGYAHILRNAEKTTLTLITCKYNTNKQLIVICELVEER